MTKLKALIETNRLAYDRLANAYAERSENRSAFQESVETLAGKTLLHAQKYFQNIRVLEIGPGAGEVLHYFGSHGCQTLAIDISPEVIRVAKARSPGTTFIRADIAEVEFRDESFEVIYMGAIVHLFPKVVALELLSNVRRWLKPNGVMFINTTIHVQSEEGFAIKEDYSGNVSRFRRKWTEEEFRAAIDQTGLSIIERLFTDESDRGKQWVAFNCMRPSSGWVAAI